MADEKLYWTTTELAEEAAKRGRPVSREYIRRLCAEGKLYAMKPSTDWLIPDWSARRWLERWVSEE